jgi:hypothetical protein
VDQNQRLMEQWQKLPRRVQDQVWVHLRHYLHSTLGVSWLADPAPDNSALLSISWRKLAVSTFLQAPAGLSGLADPISASVAGLLDRLKTTISELGYEAGFGPPRRPTPGEPGRQRVPALLQAHTRHQVAELVGAPLTRCAH